MGKIKVERTLTVGFEKHFDSLTEARTELAMIWPDTDALLDTDAGRALVQYSLLKESDEKLDATMVLLNADPFKAKRTSTGQDTMLARATGDKGKVVIVSFGGAGFGWEAVKGGGFNVFIETWSGKFFRAGDKVDKKCRDLKWHQNIEVEATKGQRRIGPVDDLKEFLKEGAERQAAMLMPERLRLEVKHG